MTGYLHTWIATAITVAMIPRGLWRYVRQSASAIASTAAPPRRGRQFTYRRLARAPEGLDDAIGAGDWALQEGLLTSAAVWYGDAERRAMGSRGIGASYFIAEVVLRMNTLTGLCLCPPKGFHPVARRERWSALRELAEIGFLANYQPAIARLGSMLYRVDRNHEEISREGRAAWRVLMTCRNLPLPALEFLDWQLRSEGLLRMRAELARHPAGTRDLWLSMLKYGRTPDLVSTIWEITGAAEDEEVRAALTAG